MALDFTGASDASRPGTIQFEDEFTVMALCSRIRSTGDFSQRPTVPENLTHFFEPSSSWTAFRTGTLKFFSS